MKARIQEWARSILAGTKPAWPTRTPDWVARMKTVIGDDHVYVVFLSKPIRSGIWETHVQQAMLIDDDRVDVLPPIVDVPDAEKAIHADSADMAALALLLKNGAEQQARAERHPVTANG